MTLHLATLEEFADAVRRILGTHDAYFVGRNGGTLLTAVKESHSHMVQCWVNTSPEKVREELAKRDIVTHPGRWSLSMEPEQDDPGHTEAFIAAVAYKSGEDTPGVWLDPYRTLPTSIQVIQNLYNEFRSTGELGEVSLEEFINKAHPNVVILRPHQIADLLKDKGSNS